MALQASSSSIPVLRLPLSSLLLPTLLSSFTSILFPFLCPFPFPTQQSFLQPVSLSSPPPFSWSVFSFLLAKETNRFVAVCSMWSLRPWMTVDCPLATCHRLGQWPRPTSGACWRCWAVLQARGQMVGDGVRMPRLRVGQNNDHSSGNCANCLGQRKSQVPEEYVWGWRVRSKDGWCCSQINIQGPSFSF